MCSNKQKKWYFATKIVLTYCECSSDREKLSRICKNFEITRTICSSSERSLVRTIFCNRMFFKLFPGGFSDLTNLNSNWKKILGFRNMQEKLENLNCYRSTSKLWKITFFDKLRLIIGTSKNPANFLLNQIKVK